MDPEWLRSPDDQGGIWPENLPATRAFLAVSSQWRWQSMGLAGARPIALDYGGARDGLALAGIDVTPELWAELRFIESGAVAELSED